MKLALKRGLLNGLLISAWYFAFCLAPRIGFWIHDLVNPVVNFNMR